MKLFFVGFIAVNSLITSSISQSIVEIPINSPSFLYTPAPAVVIRLNEPESSTYGLVHAIWYGFFIAPIISRYQLLL